MTNELAKRGEDSAESAPETVPALLKGCQKQVYNLCFQVLRHRQDAEDAAQEALFKVSDGLPSLLDLRHFDRWMYRVTLNTALNFRKRRATRLAHEKRNAFLEEIARPAGVAVESLQEAMAFLDDDSRTLVIQHFFERRSLEELAQANQCAVVTVWKRIDKAKTELARMLQRIGIWAELPDVTRILQSIEPVRAPAGLVPKGLALKGGLAMAAKGGTTLAIMAPLVLLAGASILGYIRRGDPPPGISAVHKSTAAIPTRNTPLPAPSAAAGLPLSAQPARTAQTATPRRPYPFGTAAVGASNAVAARTWEILSSKQIDLNEQRSPLAKTLEKIARLTGVPFSFDPNLRGDEPITIHGDPAPAVDWLLALLDSGDNDYEILPDGTVHVGPKSSIRGGFEREGRKLEATTQQLRNTRERMDGGWDGVADLHDPSALMAKKTFIPQGESSLEQELHRMSDDQVFVRVDVPVTDAKTNAAFQAMMFRRFLQTVEETTVGEHVDHLARISGLVAVPVDSNMFCLTTEEKAAEYRAKNDQGRRAYEGSLALLEKPFQESGALSVQDFLDSIRRSLGMPVVPSEEVWDSSAAITLPPGATMREGLNLLKAQGYRWALRNGKIWVFQ